MSRDTIYSRFRKHVQSRPDAPAVVGDALRVSYAELNCMADAILLSFPAEQQKCIGIVMSHGANMIAAMLAVLKSGAAYVPAEPTLPPDRIRYMMNEAGAGLVITDSYVNNLPIRAQAEADIPDRSCPDGVAYVLYTSGTTGKPKGVIVENHSVVNYADAFKAEFHVTAADVMLQLSVCSFDIFVEEVFTTLLNGATLAIPSAGVMKGSLLRILKFAERHGVTEISGFPYLLADINMIPDKLPQTVRLLISGGDVLRAGYISRLRERHGLMIYNTYGPSETTVCASYYRCDNATSLTDGTFSIGHPVKGVTIEILDDDLQPVPDGTTGEICIFGEGVGRGYLGNPPEQVNFVRMPDGTRFYRSGDLGYKLSDGNFAFLHRKDEQVMIFGKRVEPLEVENVLNESPEIARGVVCPYSDECGLSYLVAYFVPRKVRYSLRAIRKWLGAKLSDFMVPEFFVAMKKIPLNSHGKVDRKALPVVLKDVSKDAEARWGRQ